MKKALILLLALGMLASYAVAEDSKVEFAVSGDAALSLGYNLDTTDFGFLNESSANLTVTLVNAADKTKGTDADGAAYATITLSGLKVAFDKTTGTITGGAASMVQTGWYWVDKDGGSDIDDGEIVGVQPVLVSAPSVSAKIMFKPAYMTIFAAPGMGLNFAAPIKNATDVKADFAFASGKDYGTTFGVDMGDIKADLFIVSDTDWKDGATSNWATGVNATLKFAPVTLDLGARIPFSFSQIGFGLKAALALDPISFDAAFDGLSAGAAFSWDVRANASMKFLTASSFGLGFYMNNGTGGELSVSAALGAADAGGFSVSVSAFMVNTFANFILNANLGYTTGNITIGAGFKLNDDDSGGFSNGAMFLDLSVAVANIVPNATLTLAYNSGNLGAATAVLGEITAKIGIAF